ncbi:MAG: TolC family protein [Bdellovibrionia bacterium]
MKNNKILLSGLLVLISTPLYAMDLQEFLATTAKKNKGVQSYEEQISAAEYKRVAGDIELAPALNAGVSYLSDKSPFNQGLSLQAQGIETTSYNLGLSKKFSTGTSVQAGLNVSDIALIDVPQAVPFPTSLGLSSMSLSVSQSLWKNAFGRGTRLRQEREMETADTEKKAAELQKRLLLVQAESAFWDYVYNKEELKIREASLGRAKRIESWIRRRVNDGIADQADLLSSQALVAARELQLLMAQDEQKAAEKKIRDVLELSSDEKTPDLKGDINIRRNLVDIVGGKGPVVSFEARISQLAARARQKGAQEAKEGLRSDLVLAGSYKTNALAEDFDEAMSSFTETDRPTQSVALTWTYIFDVEAKKATLENAKKEALAAQLQAERKMLESETQWSELNRRYLELSKKIEAASRISSIQTQRAKAESEKFNKGRSITSNVINSEEDAAEAELTVTKLKTEQRKLEAQSRLFVAAE